MVMALNESFYFFFCRNSRSNRSLQMQSICNEPNGLKQTQVKANMASPKPFIISD